MSRRLLLAAIVGIVCAAAGTRVLAKGNSSALDYVVLSGGGLTGSRQVEIWLPDSYDFMSERFDIQEGPSTTGEAKFEILIHLTWPEKKDESGNVKQKAQVWEILGRYDGNSMIHLAETQYGNRAGWFVANDLFAQQLRAGLAVPDAPAAGDSLAHGERPEGWRYAKAAGLSMVLAAAVLAPLSFLRRPRRERANS